MTWRVVFDPHALQQIDEAAEWWAENRSLEQALRWTAEIYDAIARLQDRALLNPFAPETRTIGREVRQLLFGLGGKPTHRVLYFVEGSTVVVAAVRHVARAVPER